MVQITLFEFHLDDASLTANAPFSRDSEDPDPVDEGSDAPAATERSAKPLLALLGVLAVGAAAVGIRRLRESDAAVEIAPDAEEEIAAD
jgi:hypothetical protein